MPKWLRYLCHFDAAKVDLSGPDPKDDQPRIAPLISVIRQRWNSLGRHRPTQLPLNRGMNEPQLFMFAP
jgi:hypothetical protein